MPELPEVETVRRGLKPAMEGKTIASADVRRPDLRWPFPPDMAKRLAGKKILTIGRRSKYLLLDLSSGETLIIHLGMSGRMQISGNHSAEFHHKLAPAEKHDHVIFDMDDGVRVSFNDPRRFGLMDLAQTANVGDHKLLKDIGPEPLGNAFDEEYLQNRLSTRKTPIKSALLDQKIVAGLGNIYVCEVLFRAGVSPKKYANRLSGNTARQLVPIIRQVLEDAIAAGGSSLRDHRQVDGALGYFQHSFDVYGREGEACKSDGCSDTIRRISQSGRSTFYCATCQR